MDSHKRSEKFKRDEGLEKSLSKLNRLLIPSESEIISNAPDNFEKPLVLIMGAPRSGTTLLMQYLASTGQFFYPSNFISRFYNAPSTGQLILKIFSQFNQLDEFPEFNEGFNFNSDLGKTKGVLAPNEFSYFWRRYIQLNDSAHLDKEKINKIDFENFKKSFSSLIHNSGKPMAAKGMIANYLTKDLYKNFKKVLFIHVERELAFNINSLLKARINFFGNIEEWYSFPPGPNYYNFPRNNIFEEVAAQICSINEQLKKDLSELPDENKLHINHSDFCINPEMFLEQLRIKLKKLGSDISFEGVEPYDFKENKNLNTDWEDDVYKTVEVFKNLI